MVLNWKTTKKNVRAKNLINKKFRIREFGVELALMAKYQWQQKMMLDNQYHGGGFKGGWTIDSDQESPTPYRPSVRSRDIRTATLELGGGLVGGGGCRLGVWLVETAKNGNDSRVMLWLVYWSGYYYRDSVQNWRRIVVVLEVTKSESRVYKNSYKSMKGYEG